MKNFLKDKNPDLYVTTKANREKEKDKRQKLKYTSGFASEMQTDEVISIPSESSVRSASPAPGGAESQRKKSIADYYKEAARNLNQDCKIYCINVDVCSVDKYKGRRGMNVDIIFEPNGLPTKYKIDMVEREFKYEIFRNKKEYEQSLCWHRLVELFKQEKENAEMTVLAGKLRNKTYNTKIVPRKTIPNCLGALVSNGKDKAAILYFNNKEYVIPLRQPNSRSVKEGGDGGKMQYFTHTGKWLTEYWDDEDYDLEDL